MPHGSKPLVKPSSTIDRDRTKRDAKSFALNVFKTVGLPPAATFAALSAAPNGASPEKFFAVPNLNRSRRATDSCRRSAFLPGSAQYVECDVTHSKQSTDEFLPGA